MTDRPILFSGPMVRALLDGRKTQTRRIAKWTPTIRADGEIISNEAYVSGDRLWVREAFSYDSLDVDRDGTLPPWFWADGNPISGDFTRPKPSIHMPRWASRLTLIVTDVRVQRLQDISEDDARAEGASYGYAHPAAPTDGQMSERRQFQLLWDSLNARHGFGWDANPWICALTFTVNYQNIDQAREAA